MSAAAATPRLYLPRETTALALGADAVAQAIAVEGARRGIEPRLVRTGSRGACWLEPLLEVETPAGRIAYGPVRGRDVASLFDAGFTAGGDHALRLGIVDRMPYFSRQDRVTCRRLGVVDPRRLDDYVAHGGYAGLEVALAMAPAQVIQEVEASGLRGRGGAAFPTGIKWRTVLEAPGTTKYVVCNADEGDSGTFSDRLIMEGDPFALLEGMAIAAVATGAERGYIYLRSEYPLARAALEAAIAAARAGGWLGSDLRGSGRAFDVEVRVGAGAYICGEETSLLESLEGKRGEVRYRPPLPAHRGLFGRPTVVNNVVTLAAVPGILADGAERYRALGEGRSRGTLPLQLAGNVRRGGLVEKAFGATLRELIEEFGGGTRSGRPLRAVQLGGPLGPYLAASKLDTPIDYEAIAQAGGMLGHGGIVIFDDTVDLGAQARFAMEFCAHESCGKCTPCRIGSVRAVEVIDRLRAGDAGQEPLLRELCATMADGSLCGLGGLVPAVVLSALDDFHEDFARRPARAPR